MAWEKVKLDRFFIVKKGQAITKKESNPGIYPVILGGREPAYYIDKYNHTGKAIVVSRSGASAGYVSFWNEPIFITDGFLIEPKDDVVYIFVYYLLKYKQSQLIGNQRGAAIPHVTPNLLYSVEAFCPPLATQQKIADILSAYDNLIENNQKQIKLLEEAAQRLYKQWFIDLRFPGHETTKIVEGLPEGWRKMSVGECLEMHIGGGWGKETPDGKYSFAGKVIRGTDINDVKQGNFEDVPTRFHTMNDIQKRKLAEYDIVFELSNGNINNIGRSLLVDRLLLDNCGSNAICASFCKLLRAKNKFMALLLYLEIQDMQSSGRMLPYKKHGSNGINNFDFEGFLNHEFMIPFNMDILSPLFDIMQKIANIQNAFLLLKEARDRLLPKLMNGEIFFDKGI